jgi:hypothetical protein
LEIGYSGGAGYNFGALGTCTRSGKEKSMGVNRWSDVEERKRNETDAKAGDQIPKEEKGDAASRLEASEGPAENPEKREVIEKLQKRES